MMKSTVFLLVLVIGAVVNSDEGEGSFLMGGDEGEGDFFADSVDGDYFTVTRDVLYDPALAMETELPFRQAGSNLTIGNICVGCRLLFSGRPKLAAIAGQVRVQEVRYFRPYVRISAVSANRTAGSGSANPQIVAGGVGRNTVTVRFTSQVGEGFEYRMRVWGQYRRISGPRSAQEQSIL